MFKEMTKTKKIMIVAIVVLVLATIIFLIIRAKKKKKKEQESAYKPQEPIQQNVPAKSPKMQVVPEEDRVTERTPEPAIPVEKAVEIKHEKPKNPANSGAPGTLGVPGNGAGANKPAQAPLKSALPPDFMTNANDPNAG